MYQCPRYIADQGGGSTPTPVASKAVAPPPRVRLGVEWRTAGRQGERWCLVLNVPYPPPTVGAFRIDGNINGDTPLVVRGSQPQRSFPVKALARQYEARGYPDTAARGTRVPWYPRPSDPLESSYANPFDAGPGGGAQLDRDAPLIRGKSYFALARKPDIWEQPPSGHTRALPAVADCDLKGEWEGHLFFVPDEAGRPWEEWCERVFDRELCDPRPSLDLIYPPVVGSRADGAIVIREGDELFLAVRGGDWDSPVLEIRHEESHLPSLELPVSVDSSGIVRVGPFKPGTYSLYLRELELAALRVAVSTDPLATPTAVTIRTVDRGTRAELEGQLHTPDGTTRWAGLVSGDETWFGITAPERWPLALSWARGGQVERRTGLSSPEAVGETVRLCLDSDPHWARLDGGVFGAAEWNKPVSAGLTSLRTEIRNRVNWLLAARSTAAPGAGTPIGLRLRVADRLSPMDRALVARFVAVRGWPAPLLVHARSVASELAQTLQG